MKMKKSAIEEMKLRAYRYANRTMFKLFVKRRLRSMPKFDNPIFAQLIKNSSEQILKDMLASDDLHPFHMNVEKLRVWSVAIQVAKQIENLSHIVGVQPLEGQIGLINSMLYVDISEKNGGKRKSHELRIETKPMAARTRHVPMAASTCDFFKGDEEQWGYVEEEIVSAVIRMITQEVVETISGVSKETKVKFGELQPQIIKSAVEMGNGNKRGPANLMIMNPSTFSKFSKSLTPGIFHSANLRYGELFLAGSFDQNIKVFVCNFVKDNTILLGYKTGNFDAGLIYVPYLPFISDGYTISRHTFESHPIYSIRHNIYHIEKKSRFGGLPSDYYHKITISETE